MNTERAFNNKNMSELKAITKKDITALETRTNLISRQADFKITSQETLKQANELLAKLSIAKKFVKEKKDGIVKPLSMALKNARELFKPIEEKIADAEYSLKDGVIGYKKQVNEAVETQQAKIAEKVESGETSFEKASDQMSKVEEKTAEFKTRKIKKLVIIDETKIPREYLVVNETLLRKDLMAGKIVAGAKLQEEEIAVM